MDCLRVKGVSPTEGEHTSVRQDLDPPFHLYDKGVSSRVGDHLFYLAYLARGVKTTGLLGWGCGEYSLQECHFPNGPDSVYSRVSCSLSG
jgi:hypothetical protein